MSTQITSADIFTPISTDLTLVKSPTLIPDDHGRISPELANCTINGRPEWKTFRGQELQVAYKNLAALTNSIAEEYSSISKMPATHTVIDTRHTSNIMILSGIIIAFTTSSVFGAAIAVAGFVLRGFSGKVELVEEFQASLNKIDETKFTFNEKFNDALGVKQTNTSLSTLVCDYLNTSWTVLANDMINQQISKDLDFSRSILEALKLLNLEPLDETVQPESFERYITTLRHISELLNITADFVLNGFVSESERYQDRLKKLLAYLERSKT